MTISASLRFVTDFAPKARDAGAAARDLAAGLRKVAAVKPPKLSLPRAAGGTAGASKVSAKRDGLVRRERETQIAVAKARLKVDRDFERRRQQVLADSRESDVSQFARGALTVGAAAGAASLGVRGGAAVLQAQAFREDTEAAFALIRRAQGDAAQVQRLAFQTADFLGRDRGETARDFLDLLTKGITVQKTDLLVKSLADLQTVDPRANIANITRAIGQIASKGRLQGDELLQLAENGLETTTVYQELAKSMGKTVPEIIALQAKGKISSDAAIDAIIAGISTQAGGLEAGAAAANRSIKTLSGIQQRLAASIPNLLGSVELGSMDRIKDFLRDMIGLFDPATERGQRAAKAIGGAFDAFVSGLLGKDPTKDLQGGFDSLLTMLENSKPELEQAGKSLRAIGDAALLLTGAVTKMSEFKEALHITLAGLGPFGQGISNAFRDLTGLFLGGPLVGILNAIQNVRAQFEQPLTLGPWGVAIQETFAALPGQLYSVGQNVITALAQGMRDAASAVTVAATDVASGLVASARSALGIASPSKEGMAIGRFFDEGIVRGIGRSASDVMLAAKYMSADAARGAELQAMAGRSIAQAAPIAGTSAAGKPSVQNIFNFAPGAVVIPGGDAADLDARIEAGFVRALRRMNEEGGFRAGNA